MKRLTSLTFLVFTLILLTSCSSKMSKEEAVEISESFIADRIIFVVKNESAREQIPEPEIIVLNAVEDRNNWYITLRVSSEIEGEVKKKDLDITIGKEEKEILIIKEKK